jgi:hypothetical protein
MPVREVVSSRRSSIEPRAFRLLPGASLKKTHRIVLEGPVESELGTFLRSEIVFQFGRRLSDFLGLPAARLVVIR